MFHRLHISEVFLACILHSPFILLSYLPFLYLPSCPLYLFLHARKEMSHKTAPPAPWLNDIFKICGFIRMYVVSSYVKEDTSVSWPTWRQGCLQVTTWDQWSVPFSYVILGRHTVMTLLDFAFSLHFKMYNHLMLHFLWAESTQEAKSLEESSFLQTHRGRGGHCRDLV